MKTLAAILAGGSGTRFSGERPKTLALLGGIPVICHSAAIFNSSAFIDAFIIISHRDTLYDVQRLATEYGWENFRGVFCGGDTRSSSSQEALSYAVNNGYDRILIHDAARPLIGGDIIKRLCDALTTYDAAVTAVPVTDTISVSCDGVTISDIPARESLWSVQTPQGFSVPVLCDAYSRFKADPNAVATDDGGVVRRYLPKVPVALVAGSRQAIKLTYPEDLPILETFLSY